jgi:hypothetical protein
MQAASPSGAARLLPAFDPYVIGSRPRASLVEKRVENRVFRAAGWISPVILVDGMAVGVWEHRKSGGRIDVTAEPFRRLTADQQEQIAGEVDRLGTFLGAPAKLSFID